MLLKHCRSDVYKKPKVKAFSCQTVFKFIYTKRVVRFK